MTPEEIQGNYECKISIDDYRVVKKAEYKVVVELSFYSSRSHSMATTHWHIWRSFSSFRKLDEQLRKRNNVHMKGIKFPPLYRRKSIFRSNLSSNFLETRMRELDTYLKIVIRSPQLVAFHVMSIQSQTLKAFVGFSSGFGNNSFYEAQDTQLRQSISMLAPPQIGFSIENENEISDHYPEAMDEEDDSYSVSSFSTVSSMTSNFATAPGGGDYRWSGTGFRGSQSFMRPSTAPTLAPSTTGRASFGGRSTTSFLPISSSMSEGGRRSFAFGSGSGNKSHSFAGVGFSNQNNRDSLIARTPPTFIAPQLDAQRAKMEEELLKRNLVGVGMPPDGSCLLHCIVYEMYPLQCLKDYPATMTVVNVGAADGMAPRRISAARLLRLRLMEYALEHLEKFSTFLIHEMDELRDRYEVFRDTMDEQATTCELYVVASMFNIQLILISNDESFKIDPVMPIPGLPSIRQGSELRTITLGYLVPEDGVSGHYICTRDQPRGGGDNHKNNITSNSFIGGSYRGSISIGPPRPKPRRIATRY